MHCPRLVRLVPGGAGRIQLFGSKLTIDASGDVVLKGANLKMEKTTTMCSSGELAGVEPAPEQLLEAIGSRRSLVIARPGTEELRMLDYFGAEASVGGDVQQRWTILLA